MEKPTNTSFAFPRARNLAQGLVPEAPIDFHARAMPKPLFRDISAHEDLILAIAARQDRTAFAAVFAHFAPRVKAFLLRAGSDSSTADELVQEVMLTVWRKAALFDPKQATVSTWIFTIARNKRIDRFRRESPGTLDANDPSLWPEPEMPPDGRLEQAQSARRLEGALAELPPEQSTLLKMAYYDSKSHSAIAEATGLPLGTVKSRVRLALARLRQLLGPEN